MILEIKEKYQVEKTTMFDTKELAERYRVEQIQKEDNLFQIKEGYQVFSKFFKSKKEAKTYQKQIQILLKAIAYSDDFCIKHGMIEPYTHGYELINKKIKTEVKIPNVTKTPYFTLAEKMHEIIIKMFAKYDTYLTTADCDNYFVTLEKDSEKDYLQKQEDWTKKVIYYKEIMQGYHDGTWENATTIKQNTLRKELLYLQDRNCGLENEISKEVKDLRCFLKQKHFSEIPQSYKVIGKTFLSKKEARDYTNGQKKKIPPVKKIYLIGEKRFQTKADAKKYQKEIKQILKAIITGYKLNLAYESLGRGAVQTGYKLRSDLFRPMTRYTASNSPIHTPFLEMAMNFHEKVICETANAKDYFDDLEKGANALYKADQKANYPKRNFGQMTGYELTSKEHYQQMVNGTLDDDDTITSEQRILAKELIYLRGLNGNFTPAVSENVPEIKHILWKK